MPLLYAAAYAVALHQTPVVPERFEAWINPEAVAGIPDDLSAFGTRRTVAGVLSVPLPAHIPSSAVEALVVTLYGWSEGPCAVTIAVGAESARVCNGGFSDTVSFSVEFSQSALLGPVSGLAVTVSIEPPGECGPDLFDYAGVDALLAEAVYRKCEADLDNGSGVGVPDGVVGVDDLAYVLERWPEGDPRCDLDDGSGTGDSDGAVTVDDLLHFLDRYSRGC